MSGCADSWRRSPAARACLPLARTLRRMRNGPHDLPGRLVLALSLVRHLPQEIVFSPRQVSHFHDHLRPNPMHTR